MMTIRSGGGVTLVPGAGHGIGEATTRRLHAEGAGNQQAWAAT